MQSKVYARLNKEEVKKSTSNLFEYLQILYYDAKKYRLN